MTQVYGEDCTCDEMQPRRGKNLPEGSLDSRAKKLVPNDKDDYEFSIWWLSENASPVYRDESRQVVGLRNVSEVSLCKAHSSTLYRAKKRHERGKNQAPPSPADSNGIDTAMMDAIPAHSSTANHGRPYSDPYPLQPQLHHHYQIPPPYPTHMRESSLAAKVRDMKCDHQPPPDFSTMTSSTSLKRKRTNNMSLDQQRPHSSASTPLYATGMAPLLSHPPPSSSSSAVSASTSRHETPDSFTPHQLPPLQSREPLSILSSSLQHSLQVTPLYSQKQDPPSPPTPVVKNNEPEIVVETVSLKTFPTPECPSTYHIRNLAISDTFTFRDLLQEVDMIGTPPPGKKIVISDEKNEMVFPLDQAIRSVFRRPSSTHMELCVSLSDKPSIDWSMYTWGRKDIGFFSLFSFLFFLFFFFQLVISPQYNKPIPVFEKPMKKDKDFIWYTLPFSSGNDEYKWTITKTSCRSKSESERISSSTDNRNGQMLWWSWNGSASTSRSHRSRELVRNSESCEYSAYILTYGIDHGLTYQKDSVKYVSRNRFLK